MINLTVDESYAFDYLSILEIKSNKNGDKKNYKQCKENIICQIGLDNFLEIEASEEYHQLLKANLNTFNLVEAVKLNPCLGDKVDESNYERYKAKIALQKKFFNENLSEQKIGYEIYKK
jgi:hypothetical protein